MARTRYKEVVDKLAADIRAGRLRPGERLPTHRMLARSHQLALGTATRVYAELEAMGLVSGETGRGTFVRDAAWPRDLGSDLRLAAPGMVDLNYSDPSVPGQAGLLRDALRRLARAGDLESALHYQPHGGRMHERAVVARHLRSRQLRVEAEQVAIVDGAQHGLAVTSMALLRPGDVVAVDTLTYPGFRVLADMRGLELLPVPVGPQGTDVEALAQLCRTRPVRAVYVMPTLHNPLGCVMDEAARQRLVALARVHDLLLIEDAAYAFLVEQPPPPLFQLAPERTIYVSSLSKSVATGLRFGFVAAAPAHIRSIERAIRATTSNTPGLMTAIACGWIEDGTAARLEAQKREDARQRQAIAAEVLAGLPMVCHPGSYFIWLPLGPDCRADRVAATLNEQGIAVSTAEPFATTVHVPGALRLALGSVDVARLRWALERVREAVESGAL